MFGLNFLFAAALWALPLALLPIILHMLFRRKSPILLFSTLRFVKASMQQTAARRRIQRWLLLICRVLLLALLIWAVAQPVRILATGWMDSGRSMIAAIVVDTSYSMQLRQQEMTLLEKANDIILDLLREPLRNAQVAIFRSQPPPADSPETLAPVAKIQSQWTGLKPQPSRRPLAERCGAAIGFLNRQQADRKWLVVISDLQSREFPAPLPKPEDARVVLFDLHPEKPASNGVTDIHTEPQQPIPGVGTQAVVEMSGQAGDAPFFNLLINRLDGTNLKTISNLQAMFETTGRTRARVPLKEGLPAERWLLMTAQLQREDDLAWDNARAHLVELPPRQTVTLIEAPAQPAASAFVRLALDPWEGKLASWPLEVARGSDTTGRENVAVVLLADWPDAARAARFAAFAQAGGTLVLLLQPGLEQTFAKLPVADQRAIARLLPSTLAPTLPGGGLAGATGVYRVAAPSMPDRILEGLTDPSFRLNQLHVRRFVPFAPPSDPAVNTILYLSPAGGDSRVLSFGLLYRRAVGNGTVFTLATLPDSRYISPAAHPVLLPLLVSMALRPPEQRDAQNAEVGQSLAVGGHRYAGITELEVETPSRDRYRVKPAPDGEGPRFVFDRTEQPGLYIWRKPGDPAVLAVGNVQLPADESDLIYKPADSIVESGPDCLIVRSFQELQTSMQKLNEPEPRWTPVMAVVLLLMCAEALLGSLSEVWKKLPWRRQAPSDAQAPVAAA